MGDKIVKSEKIGQEQFHSFVFNERITWQEIIYDLINTEQLDPWDIDLSQLAVSYLERIRKLEEANFMLSSKILLVYSLLLRIKSELLLDRYIRDLDEVLFKRKEIQETIQFSEEIEEFEAPELLPRTPLPRYKKVSLQELISALSKAIKTEDRRIERRRLEKEVYEQAKYFIPKRTINIRQKMREIQSRIKELFQKHEKIRFSEFSGPKKQDKIDSFIPLLHLDNQNQLWLHQEAHLEEIWIHKSGERFKNEVTTDKIERDFEGKLDNKALFT